MSNPTLRGVVHGKTIELESDTGLPDGQSVTVVVQPANDEKPGAGLQASFGAWADEGEELDEYLRQCRHDRNMGRDEIDS